MSKNSFLICVYYYSLPEFPSGCNVVPNNSLLIRDVLTCNPINQHIKFGGQYDPHYEHSLAPEYKMCSKRTRRKIMSIKNNGVYDEVYLLFRTTKALLAGGASQRISGYYDVNLDKVETDPNYEEPILYAREARFVDLEEAINLSSFLARFPNLRRFPFSSETEEGGLRDFLEQWRKKIRSSHNRLNQYIHITKELDRLFKYYEFEEGIYEICEGCPNTASCFLIKRINKKGKLFHQLPADIAHRVNRYFKNR